MNQPIGSTTNHQFNTSGTSGIGYVPLDVKDEFDSLDGACGNSTAQAILVLAKVIQNCFKSYQANK